MSSDEVLLRAAERLLYEEGDFLDRQLWSDWLELFTPDVVYWVPSWKSERETTESPDTEMSLIYYTNRNGLEDRVVRAVSGLSPASTPLPRTVHAVTNIMVEPRESDLLHVSSAWTTHCYQPKSKRTELFFGRHVHVLRRVEDEWRIARRRTIIVNEMLPAVVDFYHL